MQITKKSREKLRLIIGIVTASLLVISGILFIISCYSIYKSGVSPFTRESIGRAFSRIAVVVWITLVSVVVGATVSVILPEEEKKLKGRRTDTLVLAKLRALRNTSDESDITAAVKKEEELRRILSIVNAAVLILASALPLIFLLNPNNFPAVSGEYNAEIARGMTVYLIALLPAFVYEIVYVILFDRSVKREIELCRTLPAKEISENDEKTEKCGGVLSKIKHFFAENTKEITLGVRIALVACGICFVIFGILNGGMSDVLQKAIKICTECIGLG